MINGTYFDPSLINSNSTVVETITFTNYLLMMIIGILLFFLFSMFLNWFMRITGGTD